MFYLFCLNHANVSLATVVLKKSINKSVEGCEGAKRCRRVRRRVV